MYIHLDDPAHDQSPHVNPPCQNNLATHRSTLCSRISCFCIVHPPRLGIIIFVPTVEIISTELTEYVPSLSPLEAQQVGLRNSLFNRPIHSQICDRKWWYHVESLSSASPPRIEDCRIECAGERTLAVGGDGVGRYALLCLRA